LEIPAFCFIASDGFYNLFCFYISLIIRDKDVRTSATKAHQKSGEDIEILKVNTIQSGGTFKGALRVSILLEDKNDQLAWGMAQTDQPTGEVKGGQYKGATATGAVA